MKTKCAVPFYNTLMSPHYRWCFYSPKTVRTPYTRHYTSASQIEKSTQDIERQSAKTLAQSKEFCNNYAYPRLHSYDIYVGSHIALQNQQTKLWDIYGKVVSNCRYLSIIIVSSDVEHQLHSSHLPSHVMEEQLSPTAVRTGHPHSLQLQRTT